MRGKLYPERTQELTKANGAFEVADSRVVAPNVVPCG